MLFFRLAWREICKRPGLRLLTLSSIVIGVAAVVAVSFTTQTTHSAFNAIFETVAGKAALEVVGPVNTPFDQDVLKTVSEVPGVATASPVIQRPMVIYVPKESGEADRARLTVLGVEPELDRAVHDYELVAGKWFDEGNFGIVLSKTFAKSVGVDVGSKLEVLTKSNGPVTAGVIGVFESQNTATTGQGGVMLMPLRVAQIANKAAGKLDTIQIVLKPDADLDNVKKEVAARLPEGLSVRPPAAQNKLAEQTSLSTEQGLKMARAFAVLVALFIIINTFLISVTQRRRQLGIMRAIGATKGQIARLVYSEAMALGVAGTILGCGFGYVAAKYLVSAMGSLYSTSLPRIVLDPLPFCLAGAFGIGVSLVGATFPAIKASRLSPLDAMREVLAIELEGASRWLVSAGLALVLGSVATMAATIAGYRPPAWAIGSSIILLFGLAFLLPLVLRPLSWVAEAVLRPLMRVEGRLARRELLRHRARTSLTTAAVFIAISTGIGLAINVMDNVQNVKNWYHKAIVADFFVRAMAPDMATGLAADLPDDIDPKIHAVAGIKSIEAIRYVSAVAAREQVVLVARDFAGTHELEFDLVTGNLADIREKLMQGEVVISSVLAENAKLKVGDDVPLEVGDSTKNFRIAGIANDYLAGGLTMYMERDVAKRLLGIEGIDAYILRSRSFAVGTGAGRTAKDLHDLWPAAAIVLRRPGQHRSHDERRRGRPVWDGRTRPRCGGLRRGQHADDDRFRADARAGHAADFGDDALAGAEVDYRPGADDGNRVAGARRCGRCVCRISDQLGGAAGDRSCDPIRVAPGPLDWIRGRRLDFGRRRCLGAGGAGGAA